MNKFFTRKWYEYIYSEMKDCLPKACYLRYMNNGDFFDKIITNDAEYDLDKIIIDKFEKYFTRKKNYIDSYLELEKKFGSYEKIDEEKHKKIEECECGEISIENSESHDFVDGKCVCGATEE